MTQKRVLIKEKELLDATNYNFYFNFDKTIILIPTNKGKLEIELPGSYPFNPPKIYIYSNLEELDKDDAFLNYYLEKKFNIDILEKIKSYIYPKRDKIHIKKYFYQNLNKYNNLDYFDVILDFDNILQRWSPIYKIINILKFLENLNDKYKIKDKYKFNILKKQI